MALSESFNGHNDAAAEYLFASASITNDASGSGATSQALVIRSNWAVISKRAGNPRIALELIDEALRMAAEDDSDGSPFPALFHNRAAFLEELGRYRESRDAYLQGVAQALEDGVHGRAVNGFIGLASVSQRLSDPVSAKTYLLAAKNDMGASASVSGPENVRLRPRAHWRQWKDASGGGTARSRSRSYEQQGLFWTARALRVRAEVDQGRGQHLRCRSPRPARPRACGKQHREAARIQMAPGSSWLILGRALDKQGKLFFFRDSRPQLRTCRILDAYHPQLVLAQQLSQQH